MTDPVVAVERAMIAIRRAQTRRTLAKVARERTGSTLDPALLGVLDAVEECEERGDPGTVTALASALSIDQPRASRLVARAVEEGVLRREADQADGRRAVLVLTERGRGLVDEMHSFRQAVFAETMAGWSTEDRENFGRLLTEFTRRYREISLRGR
ncbi:MarR family winged helix-turn-helix transcriptional regulator [Amycolatopsis sp. cg5]|uniref:MarR family winged helix-turn-helix transcriptional regulator n=1 Tax=Amycolatopsis sp. cg5 TaxID=3238802 RepID=UPI0035242509